MRKFRHPRGHWAATTTRRYATIVRRAAITARRAATTTRRAAATADKAATAAQTAETADDRATVWAAFSIEEATIKTDWAACMASRPPSVRAGAETGTF